MKFNHLAATTAALALISEGNAHMILENPVPYSRDTLNNFPLIASGSDYPCKLRSDTYKVTQMNNWKAGEKQTISFIGSVVHGGGSCQFSVTTDPQPSKNTQFKVIHSIIGGCPSNATGNLSPEDANGHGAATFDVALPKDMPNGQFTFAWTWFNKIGNREMYMNCAPITVTGGTGSMESLEKLPDMFVANIPSTQCANVEGTDFVFPDPGDSKVIGAQATPGTVLNGAGCGAMTKMGAGAGKMAAVPDATGAAPQVSNAPQPTAVPNSPPASNPGGVFAPGAVQTSFTTVIATKTAALPAPATVVPPAAAQPTGQAPTQPQPVSSNPGSCSSNGGVVCIGTNQFGICNNGVAVPQALAAGTVCKDGAIVAARKPRGLSRVALRFRRSFGDI